MKGRIRIAIELSCIILILFTIGAESQNVPQGDCEVKLWPKPAFYTNGTLNNQVLTINTSTFEIILTTSNNTNPTLLKHLNNIIARYQTLFSKPQEMGAENRPFHRGNDKQEPIIKEKLQVMALTKLVVNLTAVQELYSWPRNEAYNLSVPFSDTSYLNASSLSGVVWGLETFSQLILFNNPAYIHSPCVNYPSGYFIGQIPWTIEDEPRFKWRGLLVDTSRHFIPIPTLKTIIDGMSYNKMNVLHMHLTDAQSFPVQFGPPIEKLAEMGSYSQQQRYFFTEMDELQLYAIERGIMIIPEIDSPAHVYSWSYSFPELVVCGNIQPDWPTYCNEPPCGQLDPSNPETYDLLKFVLEQIGEMFFTTPFIHAGYDEVNFNCWLSAPQIVNFMENNGLNNQSLLQYYLTNQLDRFPVHKTPIFWEEVFDSQLSYPSNAVIQVWNDKSTYRDILINTTNPVLLSNSDRWYLDCGMGSWVGIGPSWCEYRNWQDIYLNEPFVELENLTPDQLDRAYGGEICIWGEQNDQYNLIQNIFPRAAAAAERLWSPRYVKDTREALSRIIAQRNRLITRGINASPVQPQWCVYNPDNCFSYLANYD